MGVTRRTFLAQGAAVMAAGSALGALEDAMGRAGREVVVQGMLIANGRLAGAKLKGYQGTWVRLQAHPRATKGLDVTVREAGGAVWYAGPATACDLGFWLFRPGPVALEAVFSRPDGIPQVQRLALETLTIKAGTLCPGLLMRMVRRGPKTPLLPAAKDFRPMGPAVGGQDPAFSKPAEDYPPFRTAESVADTGDKPFRLPDYWHRPIQDLRFGKEPGCVPVPDLWRGDVSARIEGFLLADKAGQYGFRVETTCEANLLIAGRRCLGAEQIRVKAGAFPFALTLARKGEAEPAFTLLWKEPGSEDWVPVPPERFLHLTPAAAETYYEAFTQSLAHRAFPFKPGDAPAFAGGEPPEKCDRDAWAPAATALWAHFAATGDLATAERLLQWSNAYFAYRLATYPGPQFLWLQDGQLLGDAVWLRPFLEACLRMPTLQRQALATRIAAIRNTDTVFNRSFFSETHNGTNDAYGEKNNFWGLIWQTAAIWDEPAGYDAARCLYDNHFAFRPGTLDGMVSDATFSFHNANGRQLNFGAYGRDWVNRAIRLPNFGTPWGETRRQIDRLADYALAYEWVLYRGAMAFCANGRHNEHKGVYPDVFARRLLTLPEPCLAPPRRQALTECLARVTKGESTLAGNHFLFRQLLHIHRREDYYIDVKMSSPLVGGVETFAGANPGNLSFGDGVTTLMRRGDEYNAIHRYNIPDSLWRFRSLPGTTQLDEEWGCDNEWKGLDRYRAGGGHRAGGVSDGTLGHCAFEFVSHARNATRARKLFVFSEDGLFVLGGGITGSKDAPEPFSYRTNLNQTTFRADLTLRAEDGTQEAITGDSTEAHLTYPLTQRFWIEHDGIGYLVFPSANPADKKATLHVRVSVRTPLNRLAPHIIDDPDPDMAAYKAKCKALTDQGRKATVLEIWIDHGKHPENATVAYFVHMRATDANPATLLKTPPFAVYANDETCQAVRDNATDTLHAFFYQPGAIKAGSLRLAIDKPAALMLRTKNGRKALTYQAPVVACTNDTAQHAQAFTLTLGHRRVKLRLPGAGDPDDRRRGAPTTIPV